MSMVADLLKAIIAAEGDAAVLHNGDIPYVAAGGGETEIGTAPFTFEDVTAVLEHVLPEPKLRAFNRLGAIRYECPPSADYPGQRFTVVAVRDAAELWVEIRRGGGSAQPGPAETVSTDDVDVPDHADVQKHVNVPAPAVARSKVPDDSDGSLTLPAFEELWPNQPREQTIHSNSWREIDPSRVARPPEATARPEDSMHPESWDEPKVADVEDAPPVQPDASSLRAPAPHQPLEARPVATERTWGGLDEFDLQMSDAALAPPQRSAPVEHAAPPPAASTPRTPVPPPRSEDRRAAAPPPSLEAPLGVTETAQSPAPSAEAPASGPHAVPPRQAVVLPMARNQIRNDTLEPLRDLSAGGLIRLLRIVAARGGSALYLASDAQPSMRVDGELQVLDDEKPMSAADTEALLLGVMPERTHEALRSGERTEWHSDVRDFGQVRCVSFRDHRGAGGIFRILSARAVSAEQLGLTREVQALALQPEGLVVVAGPRSSGKSTLISAFVDLINRTRRDHVITIESEIQILHESRGSMISQREVRADAPGLLAAVRSALREDPDVLAIEELRDDAIMQLALEAAGSGRLVIGGLPAHTAADAVDRILDKYPPDQRRHAQLTLAENLRGIIVQTLLRKQGGGRVAAREVLLNTPAVATLIADGRTSQLSLAIEAGRKVGMMSLNESLAALVKSGAVDGNEAYRRAGDRRGLFALLKRHGIDTSRIERRAVPRESNAAPNIMPGQ